MTTPPPPRYPIVYTHCFSRTAPSLQAPSFHDHSTGYPPPLSTKSSAAATASRRSLCHCSFVVYIALPPFLQRDPLSLVLQPTVSACHLAVSFLFCAENPAASPSCMRQGFPQTNFRVFLTHQQLQGLNLHLHVVAFVQVIFHCRNHPSFPSAPDTWLCFQIHLPLTFVRRRKRNLLWRTQQYPSSGVRRRFHRRSCITHHSLTLLVRKRTASSTNSQSESNGKPSQTSVTTEEGETSTTATTGFFSTLVTVPESQSDTPQVTRGTTTTLRNLSLT